MRPERREQSDVLDARVDGAHEQPVLCLEAFRRDAVDAAISLLADRDQSQRMQLELALFDAFPLRKGGGLNTHGLAFNADDRPRGQGTLALDLHQEADRPIELGRRRVELSRAFALADEHAAGLHLARQPIAVDIQRGALIPAGHRRVAQDRGPLVQQPQVGVPAELLCHQDQRGGLTVEQGVQFGIEDRRDGESLRPGMPDIEDGILVEARLQNVLPLR
jgi:hypothetical protein